MPYHTALVEASIVLKDGGKPEIMSQLVEEKANSLRDDGWQIISVAPVSFGTVPAEYTDGPFGTVFQVNPKHSLVATSFMIVCRK